MKDKIVKVLQNKRARYLIVTSVLVLFCFAMNIAFSAFTSSAGGVAANLTVRNMTYSVKINGTTGTIVKATKSGLTKINTTFTATNTTSSKYELSYDVCSDSTCSSTISKPSTLTVQYSSRTTDAYTGTITATGTVNIRVIITNNASSDVYIRLKMNAGYTHNTLTLDKKVTGPYNEDDLTVYSYINGTKSDSFPTGSDYAANVSCEIDGGGNSNATGSASWDGSKWNVSVTGVDTGRTVCNVQFSYVKNFAYNGTTGSDGSVQTLSVPYTGKYKLEVWGAQGGSYSTYYGGLGGYSYGTISLTKGATLYVYVGGQPVSTSSTSAAIAGGYNGGGQARVHSYSGTTTYCQAGGGASDIRVGQDSLYARVIVAGGGGGSASLNDATTKYGGGTSGGSSVSGFVGTQTAAGQGASFGVGGNGYISGYNYKYASGGGGGGWYGGGAVSSHSDSATAYRNQNGGGSGYVYTSATASSCPSGCLLTSTYYLTNAATVAGNTSFISPTGTNETGHSGNGYARVTYMP